MLDKMLRRITRTLEEKPYKLYFYLALFLNFDAFLGPYRPILLKDGFDSKFVTIKILAQHLLHSGILSWDPVLLPGTQAWTTGMHPFNPFILLTLVLPLWLVYSVWSIAFVFIAGLGMHLYLNRQLELSTPASAIGSIFFMSLSMFNFYPDHNFLVSFPLYLYLFDRLTLKGEGISWRWGILLILLIFSFHAPWTVPYFPILHLFIILGLTRPKDRLMLQLKFFVGFWICYAFLHAPSLYSLITEQLESHRYYFSDIKLRNFPVFISAIKTIRHMLRMLPSTIVFVFSFVLLSLFLPKQRKILFWWSLYGVICGAYILYNSPIFTQLSETFPFLGVFHTGRIYELSNGFLLSVLVGYGAHYLITRHSTVVYSTLLLLLSILLYEMLLRDAGWMHPPTVRLKLLFYYSTFFYVAFLLAYTFFSRFKAQSVSLHILCFICLFVLTFNNMDYRLTRHLDQHFNYFFDNHNVKTIKKELTETSPFRSAISVGKWAGSNHSSYLQYHGLQTADGYHTMYPSRYKKLWLQMIDQNYKEHFSTWIKNFTDWGSRPYLPYLAKSEEAEGRFNMGLVSLLNIKYIFASHHIEDSEKKGMSLYLKPLAKDGRKNFSQYPPVIQSLLNNIYHYFMSRINLYVYRVNSVLPRTFVVSDWVILESEEAILKELSQRSADQHFKQVLFLKSDLKNTELPKETSKDLTHSAQVVSYKPSEVKIEGFSNQDGFLILSDMYHKHWQATVDGRPTSVVPAYFTLRAVQTPKGKFSVVFKYHDWRLNLCHAFIPIGIFFLFYGWHRRKQQNQYS